MQRVRRKKHTYDCADNTLEHETFAIYTQDA